MTDILNSNNLSDDQNKETMFENIPTKTIQPDPNFRMELKNKIMDELNLQSKPSKIPSLRVNFAFAGFAVLVLAVVSIVGQDLLFNHYYSNGLSASEKQNILSQIASNNPLGLLQRNNNNYAMNANTEAQLSIGSGATAPVASKDMSYYSVPADMYNQDSYTYSRQEFTFGPKINQCPQYNYIPGIGDSITESYYYNNWSEKSDYKYYSKYISKTKDGQILDYSLSDGNVSYEYHGGTYAVKLIYPQVDEQPLLKVPSTQEELRMLEPVNVPSDIVPISEIPIQEPSPTPMPIDEQIAAMFGNPDSIVVEKVTENGNEYYVITYSDPYICSSGGPLMYSSRGSTMGYSQPTTNPIKVLTKAWVDPKSFSIVKQASYVTMIAPENLIIQTKYFNDTQSIAFDKVASIFNFDLNVEVKEVVIPTSPAYGTDAYYAKINEFIAQNPGTILTPTSSGVNISWINVAFEGDPWNFEYYYDRDFYSPSSYGDAQYNMFTQYQKTTTYVPAIYTISANSYSLVPVSSENQGGYKSVTWSLDIYPKGHTLNEIKISNWGTDADSYLVLENTTSFTIGGKSVQAEIYDIPAVSTIGGGDTPVAVEGGETQGSEGAKPMPDYFVTPEPATNKVVMFTADGYTYVINIYAQPVTNIESLLQFKEYDLSKEADKNAFVNLIKEIQINPVGSEIAPVLPETTEILPR